MTRQQRLFMSALIMAGATMSIGAGVYIGLVLMEATRRGPWAVAAWAVTLAVGCIAGAYAGERMRSDIKRNKR